jgi:hypothetical protein
VNAPDEPPRDRDEWRVEIALDKEQHLDSLSDRLHELQLDNEARKRLGGSLIVTRDGRFLFVYAWHKESAQEAERVVKNMMQNDKLVGQVRLMRWHPVAEEWKDADEELPEDEAALAQEMREAEQEGTREAHYGQFPWQVVIDLPHIRDGHALANKLRGEGLPVKRHFKYLLVGTTTEDSAIELGKRLEGEVPEGSRLGVRGNPRDMPDPTFVNLSAALKPGFLRDIGL